MYIEVSVLTNVMQLVAFFKFHFTSDSQDHEYKDFFYCEFLKLCS